MEMMAGRFFLSCRGALTVLVELSVKLVVQFLTQISSYVVLFDFEDEVENIEEPTIDSPPVGLEDDKVVVVSASLSTLPEPKDIELKNVLSNISKEKVGKLIVAYDIHNNITLR
ncbi:hypothetical protein FNV43_RR07376 [Rhamnella rubrinervis]|uniref:Uncharacterized protein n=1 Tax=Rhamnella rubrinervis TaxID=2594499 RepID=A0A8K0MM49_9ROSA|nr:hypothetical protein FNV43_RR07376 [Rhamnella rubrinervis]